MNILRALADIGIGFSLAIGTTWIYNHRHGIYHGKNMAQCYYRPECLVCWITLFFMMLALFFRK